MDARKMMGFNPPGDERVPVPVRNWNAMKLALWRSKTMWERAAIAAASILERCVHAEGCQGAEVETAPCSMKCADRETRMDALVILNAARMFATIDARKPADGSYFAPSREYFSEVLTALASLQVENDLLRDALRKAGVEPPSPKPDADPVLPIQQAPAQLEESTT